MITADTLQNFEEAITLEWLETNGLGGYASSTVSGANSRRYHGMLVAAMKPPVERMVVISKLEESLRVGDQRFELSANQYPGVVYPQGYQHLTGFKKDLFPEFTYTAGSVELKKTIAMLQGENTTLVMYEVLSAPSSFTLELMALYSCKDFHAEAHANDSIHHHYLFQDGIFRTFNYQGCPEFFISVPNAQFQDSKNWYYNFEHPVEQYRGLDFKEDLFTHGKFSVILKKGDRLVLILSLDDPEGRDGWKLFEEEKKRRKEILHGYANQKHQQLVLAADQFVVKRGNLNTIIAGYPWFSDWGRDTMIALPGLCLVTGRYDIAKNILQQFAAYRNEGMLPNRFPDHGEIPEYNTIDATLWFFVAIYRYYKHTNDVEFISELLPALEDSLDWHYKGTRYNIKVDAADELLSGGEPGVQLTWMDAKVGDWVVTPRTGKPVEINALWYNALMIIAELMTKTGENQKAASYKKKAARVHKSFNSLFWNTQDEYLYDCISEGQPVNDLRPNQLYAISLPFPLLSKDRAQKVLKAVQKHLLTPKGLRSLSPQHPDYQPVYGGQVWQRDGSYHQGTVWSFLLGPYCDGVMYAEGEAGTKRIKKVIDQFLKHLEEACVGSVSEIFDGQAPHTPRGCFAQAWGVAEILRVIHQYNLITADKSSAKKTRL